MKILLLGDSLIEFFDWQHRFPSYTMLNRGVAGETVGGLLARLPLLENSVKDADTVVVMIGTNNLAMDDYSFLPDYKKVLDFLKREFPLARLAVTSLLPIRLPWLADNAVERVNVSLQKLAEDCSADYIEVYEPFMVCREKGDTCFLEDGVHLTDAGYERWATVLAEYL